MCGRYFITKEMDLKFRQRIRDHKWQNDPINRNKKKLKEAEIEIDKEIETETITENDLNKEIIDIYPGDVTAVLSEDREPVLMKWGFNVSNSTLINARTESVFDKPTFKDHIRNKRVVVPAVGFYEWDRNKNKNTFTNKKSEPMYFAAFSRDEEDGPHFIIMTREANSSMAPVHDRMPLILKESEIDAWLANNEPVNITNKIRSNNDYLTLLAKEPPELDRDSDQEQISLF